MVLFALGGVEVFASAGDLLRIHPEGVHYLVCSIMTSTFSENASSDYQNLFLEGVKHPKNLAHLQ